jgi:hypothetical protein
MHSGRIIGRVMHGFCIETIWDLDALALTGMVNLSDSAVFLAIQQYTLLGDTPISSSSRRASRTCSFAALQAEALLHDKRLQQMRSVTAGR